MAALAAPLLRLLNDPPLVSSLSARGHSVDIFSFLTGFDAPMASWSAETLGVFVLAPLVLVLAAPAPRLPARLVAAVLVLGLAVCVTTAIAVTQIKLVVEAHATSQLGITLHSAAEKARLRKVDDTLHVVGVMALPALLFVAMYAWGLWLPPREGSTVGSRRATIVALSVAGGLAAATAIGLAAVPAASRDAGQYHAGWAGVLRLNPGFAPAQVNLALHLEANGQLAEAIELYRAAATARPDMLATHYNLANALRKTGQHEAAATSYRRVLSLDPGHAGAHRNLGLSLAVVGRECEAVEQLRLSTRLDATAAANPRLLEEIARLEALCRAGEPLP